MKRIDLLLMALMVFVCFAGCTKTGCTDCSAMNYDETAQKDNSSCIYGIRSIVGKYACVRNSGYGNSTGENIELEIYPVRTSDKLLKACDASLGIAFFMTYDNAGNLHDTLVSPGIPWYMRQCQGNSIAARVNGHYGSDSVHIDYSWANEMYSYSGLKIKTYPVVFDTPDYRENWTGSYNGKLFYYQYTGLGENNSESDATLSVYLTDDDTIVRIEHNDNNSTWYNLTVRQDGSFDNVNLDGCASPISTTGNFNGDSIIIRRWEQSPGGYWEWTYKCKKQ
ncbi:MAG: hypothetical protein J6W06_09555 [Bacteroidales bacterium]|nr:hypothetical protein [Bacteroidales bacterium]